MKRGFTFIELIVIISIIGIVVGGMLANYLLTSQSEIFRAAKSEVLDYIRLARQQSQTSQLPSGCTIDSLMGYGLVVSTATNTIQLTYFCPGAAATPIRSLVLGSSYLNMSVTSLTAGGVATGNFYFRRLTGVTSTGNDVTLCLQHTQMLKYVRIVVRTSGKIDTYDNQPTCP